HALPSTPGLLDANDVRDLYPGTRRRKRSHKLRIAKHGHRLLFRKSRLTDATIERVERPDLYRGWLSTPNLDVKTGVTTDSRSPILEHHLLGSERAVGFGLATLIADRNKHSTSGFTVPTSHEDLNRNFHLMWSALRNTYERNDLPPTRCRVGIAIDDNLGDLIPRKIRRNSWMRRCLS